MANYLKIFRMK